MIDRTDAELLRCYADEKSELAFAELVRRRMNLVYSVALRQCGGDAQLAEDVTQKVFTDCARKAAALAQRPVLSGWLYRSAQFAASDIVRAERRRRAREEEAQIMQTTTNELSAPADWEKVRPVLDEAMGELGDAERDAVALRFFEGRSFAEIGAVLRLSEDAARKRVNRAVDKLHALLSHRGVTSTSAALSIALAHQGSIAAPAGLAASVTNAAMSGGATAAGVGSVAAMVYFMSASKITIPLAALAALAGSFTVYQSSQARVVAAEVDHMRAEHAALTARLVSLQTAATTAEKAKRDTAAERTQAVRAAAATVAKAAQVAADEQKRQQDKALEEFLSRDPELLKLRYDYNVATYKAWSVWKPDSSGADLDTRAKKNAEDGEGDEVKRAAGIDAPPRNRLPGWEAGTLANNLIPRFLYYLDEPYTTEQAARMQAVLKNAQTSTDSSGSSNFTIYHKFDWDRVLPEAAGILSPRQVEALRGMAAWARDTVLIAEAAKEAAASSAK